MKEPIRHFFNKYGFQPKLIKHLICGEKYIAVMLNDGKTGVCSTLMNHVPEFIPEIHDKNIDDTANRIILNAYYNALLNNNNNYDHIIDIFNAIDFKEYEEIVMIGFFKSLVKKFKNEHIPLQIFDKIEQNPVLTDMKEQMQAVSKADCIILSGTTVFNHTYKEITENSRNNCDIFLLLPSNILHDDMFHYKNIKVVFGSVFEKYDYRLLEIIAEGGGTRSFLKHLKKVYLSNL